MSKIIPDPNSPAAPAVGGRVVYSTFLGRPYVRKWPKRVGPPKSPYVQETVARFVAANRYAKLGAAEQTIEAMAATKRTGLYPRDLMVKAMTSTLFELVLPDGQVIGRAPLTYEVPVFIGFSIYRTAPLTLSAGVDTLIEWDAAEANAIGLWDPLNPTYITVPNGVTIMSFSAQVPFASNVNSSVFAQIAFPDNTNLRAQQGVNSSAIARFSFTTGPVVVSGGQQFGVTVSSSAGRGVLTGRDRLRFSGQILG